MTYVIPPWTQPQSVVSRLVTPMSETLFTLADAKLRAGLNWAAGDPRDGLMSDLILAAQGRVEQDTGLALLTQVHEVTFSGSDDWLPLPSQCTPAQAIEDVAGGVPTVRRLGSLAWSPVALAPGYSGTLRVTSGWTSKADLKARAPLLYHAVGLLLAHYATVGRDLAITGTIVAEVPEGYEATVQPYRLVWMP